MNPDPEFPLVSFSEGFPIDKAGMEVASNETLGLACRRDYANGCLGLKQERFYSKNGFRYRVAAIAPEPKFNKMQKLLARLWRPYHLVRVAVQLENDGPWEIGPIKERIRGMLAHDPGDLLYQWTDEEEWNRGLESASTPRQLIDFLTNVALVEHDDNQENDS